MEADARVIHARLSFSGNYASRMFPTCALQYFSGMSGRFHAIIVPLSLERGFLARCRVASALTPQKRAHLCDRTRIESPEGRSRTVGKVAL